jgi:integrase
MISVSLMFRRRAISRKPARDWIIILALGQDPKAEMERREREQARKKDHTFASVIEAYIDERVIGPNKERPIMRKWKYVTRVLRDPFAKTLKERPIATIDRADILAIIKLKKKRHPAEARSQLAVVKSLFSWALDQSFGLERSVCSDIKPRAVIGEKNSRERALTDNEITALWRAADQTPYPVGPIYKMLLLSGLRRNEVVRASWSEFDLAKQTWIIPAARMGCIRPADIEREAPSAGRRGRAVGGRHRERLALSLRPHPLSGCLTSVKRPPCAAPEPARPPPAPRSTQAAPTARTAPTSGPATYTQ